MLKHKRVQIVTFEGATKTKRTIKQSNILKNKSYNHNDINRMDDRIPMLDILTESISKDEDPSIYEPVADSEENINSNRHNTLRGQFRSSLRNNYAILLGYHIARTNQCQAENCEVEGSWRCVSCSLGMYVLIYRHKISSMVRC